MKMGNVYLGLIIILLASGYTSADIIEVHVEGVVTTSGGSVTGGNFAQDGSITSGTAMTGYCIYDTDQYPSGTYNLTYVEMAIGNYTFSPSVGTYGRFRIESYIPDYKIGARDAQFDGTIWVDGVPKSSDEITWGNNYFELMLLYSSSEDVPIDISLPDTDTFPESLFFDERQKFGVNFFAETGFFAFQGDITSYTVVPEPATILLLSLGSLLLRRKKH